jgi:hypothetical protein
MGEALRVVHVFVSRQPAVYRLPQQISEGQARILRPTIGELLSDEVAESQAFVQLPNQNQTTFGSEVTRDPWKSTLNEGLKES